MKIKLFFLFGVLNILLFQNCDRPTKTLAREVRFNNNWKFLRMDLADGHLPKMNDSDWRTVDLPHDYSIEDLPTEKGMNVGPFTKKSAGGPDTGHVLGGTGWYRKHFKLAQEDAGKIVKVLFDGVYMNADVWINGHHLGNHPYGYTAFYYDLTPYLAATGEENVLAVQVKNEGKNSRWYSGSGIYRNVSLIKTNPIYIDIWGTYLTTTDVSDKQATIHIESKIVNETEIEKQVLINVEIKDPSGLVVGKSQEKSSIDANAKITVKSFISLEFPNLWSIENPNLYTITVQVHDNGKLVDQTIEKIGVRSIEFSPEEGFLLNGKNVLLKGACMHHDNGILGSAAFDRAEFRKVKIMKDYGYNAIRTAHNPPSKAFLDACDHLGMLVIDESFDMWQRPKREMDYNLYFDDWWERDMESMLLRDRNHPSIIMWSFGNEISERADSSGLVIARKLIDKIHALDPTRPATQAICKFWEFTGRPWEDTAPAFDLLDVHSYNYQWQVYEEDHKKHPERVMFASESIGGESFENWQKVKQLPYVIGDFVWTGMDYFGESGIGHSIYKETQKEEWLGLPPWPWFNSNCGDIDVLGYKKPQGVYKDVVWGNSNLELAVHEPIGNDMFEHVSYWGWPNEYQSWNWEGSEDIPLKVNVYSNYDEVTLELNGKEIDTKPVSEATHLTATFKVPYTAGELTAIGFENGEEVGRKTLKTSGKPYQLHITPERESIEASSDDLAYFNVEVLDEQGLLVPNAELPIEFNIQGSGKLQAIGNGNPMDMHSFQQPGITTFKGRCQLIVRLGKQGDEIVVTANFADLKAGEAKVTIKK